MKLAESEGLGSVPFSRGALFSRNGKVRHWGGAQRNWMMMTTGWAYRRFGSFVGGRVGLDCCDGDGDDINFGAFVCVHIRIHVWSM